MQEADRVVVAASDGLFDGVRKGWWDWRVRNNGDLE
jgi:hypothetical protein